MLGASSPSGSIIRPAGSTTGLLEAISVLLEALPACWKHYLSCWKHYRPAGSIICPAGSIVAFLWLGRAEEIAAILQEFRLNKSPSRGIAANLHHFRPFCFKPKRNGGNSCNFAGFPFWNSRPYRIAVFLQDFACRIGVSGKIVEFADFAYRIGVSGEIVEFAGFRLPNRRVWRNRGVCRISLTESACLEKSWSLRISPAE
ncbi:hypothetical protein [Paenibacillus dendritiformis]|uniref:hypothetical protein n=1 Tax=Paenibacillus dendritiformis TaxID=130049 RepID=UPI001BCAF908|nr:hypothetical protein [Paenibacillus dendritiformis]